MGTTTKSPKATAVVLGPGSILSEASFYVVQKIVGDKVIVHDDFGHEITLSQRYVNEITVNADAYTSEEKKSMTELGEIFVNSPRIAMTVAYITKGTEKTKKEYDAEKKAKIDEIVNATLKNTPALLSDLIDNPITREIPGKLRVMKGRHYGNQETSTGRVHFIDMELKKDPTKDYDTRTRQVDPRTIQWLIVNKVKYTLK